ncbi:outer membrane beta-barrel protein [Niabella beijingensis]|uniref:outer membrane beta-barrel protein n=1 Tax=Niabella beijingensis TaxID=2872700 RepID=UPI0023E3E7C5|nr:outer membrane beta-barrel protein [Niabella beijingensis]
MLLLLFFCATRAAAQGTITGKLVDSATQKPLYMATITVFKAADTSVVTYRLSGEDGMFRIPGLSPELPYRVIVTFTGYGVYRKEFLLSREAPNLNLGTIGLQTGATDLDEVLVVAERPPMVIRKDTVEFNANAFKTLPNALVEDLLKKLPGVQVDKQGNIMVNGKRVNRILVDGKNFFGSDPKMASRNLPSNVIDKIQVTDDKDELLERGDDNLNNVGKVINLTFKKGVKKGVFGKAYAGGGGGINGSRFEGGAIANIFRDTLQVSLLGYSNNLNRPGFGWSDLMQTGGLQRNRDVSGSGNNSSNNSNFGSNIMINGINFGGMSRLGGVTTSNGLGFNLNHSPNKKKSFFAQYYFGKVHTDVETDNTTRIFNNDTVITNRSLYNTVLRGNTHTFGIGMNLKPDTLTTITATASYILGQEQNNNKNEQNGTHNFFGELNNGNVLINGNTRNDILRENFSLTRLSKTKSGRRISFAQGVVWNKKHTDSYTDALIHYLYPRQLDSVTNQLRAELIPTWFAYAGINYREPLGKKWFLRAGARYEYENLKNDVGTFDKSGDQYDQRNGSLSSTFLRNSNRYQASTGLEFKHKDLAITPGVRYQYQQFENTVSGIPDPLIQKQSNVLPQLEITYRKLTVNFTRDVVLPDYNYLLPVRNNTNPYVINIGNTGLLPAVMNRVYANLNTFNPKNNLNVWSWGEAYIADNDVVQSITIDSSGLQTIRAVNANGSKRIAANFGLNQDIKYKNSFTFSWNVGTWTEYRENKFFYNEEASIQKRLNSNIWSNVGFNWNDKLEINPAYSFSYMSVKNTNPRFTPARSFDQTMGTEVIVRYIKHVIFDTELRYLNNNAFADPQYRKMFMWNAGVNFTFFEDERAVLRLYANDLLNQTRNTDIIPYQNTVRTTYSNILGQYFLATFTYNLRPAGAKKKVGGGWSLW